MAASRKIGAALALATCATGADAQMRPSPLKDIYASYNDCFKVATPAGIQPSVLQALGWSRATASKDGKQVASELAVFGHPQRTPLIMLSSQTGKGLCIVVAQLESLAAFDQFKSAFGDKLPAPDAEGNITFVADDHVVLLKQTGSRKQPAMSIAVMTPVEKK